MIFTNYNLPRTPSSSEKFEDLADRFSEAKRRKIAIDDREAELIMVEEQVVVGGVKQVPPPRNFSF